MYIGRHLASAVIALGLGAEIDAQPSDGIAWRWHQSGYDLYDPEFSADGTEIVLVRQRHTPDGGEAVGVPRERLDEIRRRIALEPRYADPEVFVLQLGSGEASERIDWGWAPTFAPDGTRIAFAAQTNPISGYRILASTLAGNEIRIYDRGTREIAVLAKPETGYLTNPVFSPDGRGLAFSLADAVNGSYGGGIGIANADLETGAVEILYPVTREHGVPHIAEPKRFVGERLLARICRPDKPEHDFVYHYHCDVVAPGAPTQPVFSWGRRTIEDFGRLDFAAGPGAELLVHDDEWSTTRASTSTEKSDPFARAGTVSPDGRLVAESDYASVRIRPLTDRASEGRSWEFEGEMRQVTWSPDSKHLAIVVTQYRPSTFDELLLLEP
jgi:dipeptidyl aminopeptidase/acylaminoacyl peptidase